MANLNVRTELLEFSNSSHFLKRCSFSPSKSNILFLIDKSSTEAIDILFGQSISIIPEPIALDTNLPFIRTYNNQIVQSTVMDNNSKYQMITSWYLYQSQTIFSIKYKLSYFLTTNFVINYTSIENFAFSFDYLDLTQKYWNGSIKQFAKKISRLNAMHLYLNNNLNVVGSPNENYAREFLELFTIGKGPQDGSGSYTNYNEHDIQQAARILTGFTNINENERLNYLDAECNIPLGKKVFANHDCGNKTFSAKFGNQTIIGATNVSEMDVELDTFIDMVFTQPETAKNYARRIYRYFVRRNISNEIETDIILPLANNLLATEYNIESTVKILLRSIHFYDEDGSLIGDEIIGSKIKSPFELSMIMINQFKISTLNPIVNPQLVLYHFYHNFIWGNMLINSQQLFEPDTVEGHPAYSQKPLYDMHWINNITLKSRYNNFIVSLINGVSSNGQTIKFNVIDYIRNSGDYSNPSNAITLIDEFLELCFCNIPTGDRYIYFKQAMLGNLSVINWQHEWDNYIATNNDSAIKVALERFVRAVVQSPEYQLY